MDSPFACMVSINRCPYSRIEVEISLHKDFHLPFRVKKIE